MKARAEERSPSARASPTASSSAVAAASATSSSRCSCSSSSTAATTPRVRSPTTLDALHELADGGYVDAPPTPTDSTAAYRFLRTVEHRLQLVRRAADPHRPGRRATPRPGSPACSGYRDATGPHRAASASTTDHRQHQARSRVDPRAAVLRARCSRRSRVAGPLSPEAAEERLAAFGFTDVERTRAAVRELAAGLTRRSRLMQQLLPVILGWLSETPDPDLGLLQLRRLAEGRPVPRSLAITFRESPGRRRARRVTSSDRAGSLGRRAPSPSRVRRRAGRRRRAASRRPAPSSSTTRSTRWSGAATRSDAPRGAAPLQATRAAAHRGPRPARLRRRRRSTERELTDARRGVRSRSRSTSLEPTVAVRGDRHGTPRRRRAVVRLRPRRAVRVRRRRRRRLRRRRAASPTSSSPEIGATTAEGQTFRIDAGLRPEGKQGPLARSLDGYAPTTSGGRSRGSARRSQGARSSPATPTLGARFVDGRRRRSSTGSPFTDDDVREIRRMKARIERERIPPGEDPQFHLKLGRGSLSDIEFTVQLLQLEHGADHPERARPRHDRRARASRCARPARRRRRRRPRRGLPVLRTGAQRALPPER